jgi:hypothetical protein
VRLESHDATDPSRLDSVTGSNSKVVTANLAPRQRVCSALSTESAKLLVQVLAQSGRIRHSCEHHRYLVSIRTAVSSTAWGNDTAVSMAFSNDGAVRLHGAHVGER